VRRNIGAGTVALEDGLAIVVYGNKTAHVGGAAIGDYVLVKNSTIADILDGGYTAAKAIPANTAIDKTYLTACANGIANSLSEQIVTKAYTKASNVITWDLIKIGNLLIISATAGSLTSAISAGSEFIALTTISSDFAGKSFVTDEQFPIANNPAMRCVIRKDGSYLLAYGENNGQIPSGTAIRVTVVCAIK
jgi:hypothetical protein